MDERKCAYQRFRKVWASLALVSLPEENIVKYEQKKVLLDANCWINNKKQCMEMAYKFLLDIWTGYFVITTGPVRDEAVFTGGQVPPVLNLVNRGEHFSWNPEEERKRQERWQQEQERMLQEKYRREQEKLKQEWEEAQKEVEEEERRYHEEERKILEETVTPLTPHSPIAPSALPKTQCTLNSQPEREYKQGPVEKQTSSENCRQRENGIGETAQRKTESLQMALSSSLQGHGDQEKQPKLKSSQDMPLDNRQIKEQNEAWKKNTTQPKPGGRKRSDSIENIGPNSSPSPSFTDTQAPPSPNRSVSGKKLCSSCGHPLGKGAAMIIETLSLYFHIQCFKCGICKGQLGDTSTGTDVRIRNGLLNCHQCYIRSRSAGQPTTL